jgi:hypothetical protein
MSISHPLDPSCWQIKLWDTSSRRMLTCLDGLEAVMDFAWAGNTLLGGNRKGYCQVWDLQRADMIRSVNCPQQSPHALGAFAC